MEKLGLTRSCGVMSEFDEGVGEEVQSEDYKIDPETGKIEGEKALIPAEEERNEGGCGAAVEAARGNGFGVRRSK